jgi:fermentation-respiration switch protein FrsA (DUF1100 family)
MATSSNPTAARPPLHWSLRLLRILAVSYLGVLLVLLVLENSMLFRPTRAAEDWGSPPNSRVQDVDLQTADGIAVHAWWCPVEGARGAMLYCHGNAGNLSHRSAQVAAWQYHLKESVLIFDYPGYGKSAGKPSEAGCYAAAEAAYDWLVQTAKVPADRILLYGGSLGGGVAVELARHRPHRALVLLSTFTSIPDMAQKQFPWLPARWLVRNRFDNLAKIGQCTQPVFIAHGDCDGLVPYSHGQRLFAAANEPKAFFTRQGGGHNEPPRQDLFDALRQFLKEVEAKAK